MFDGRAEDLESPPSSPDEALQPAKQSYALPGIEISPANIPLPPSPTVESNEAESFSPYDLDTAQLPSPAQSAQQKSHDALREGLRRLAELRMSALEVRTVKKEERTNIRNLRRQLVYEVRRLIASMKEKLPAVTTEDLTSWEDTFILIEDVAEESEQADIKFDREERHIIDLEYDLCDLEEELYGETEGQDLKPDQYKNNVLQKQPSRSFVGAKFGFSSSPTRSVNPSSYHSPSRVEAEAQLYRHQMLPSGPSVGSASAEEFFGPSLRAQEEALPTDQASLSGSLPHEPEATNLYNGWQFIDVDTAAIRDEASKTGMFADDSPDPSFSRDDFYGLSRWLLYGTPWNTNIMSSENKLRVVVSNLQIFRAWLVGNLEALVAPHDHSAGDERNFSMLTRYVRNWQWDPSAHPDAGPEDPVLLDHDTLRGDVDTSGQASKIQRAPSVAFFEPLNVNEALAEASPIVTQSNAVPATFPLDRRKVSAHAPSEALARGVSRNDFLAHQERRDRSQSQP